MLTAGMDGAEFFPAGRGEAREKIFGAGWGRGKARVKPSGRGGAKLEYIS